MTKIKNPNCDGEHCTSDKGEVRVLPVGECGKFILCRSCYEYEINYRQWRNQDLENAAQYPLPSWASLTIYQS